MENQKLVSLSRQCSSTPVGFGHRFLSKEQHATQGHPTYSSGLAPADVYLLPGLKSTLKGGGLL